VHTRPHVRALRRRVRDTAAGAPFDDDVTTAFVGPSSIQ